MPSGQDGVEISQPESVPSPEVVDHKDRKGKWGSLRKLILIGTTLASGWQSYEFWAPRVEAMRAERGSKVEFSLKSKVENGKQTDFAIEKQADGKYIVRGSMRGGPSVVAPKEGGGFTQEGEGELSFVLPASTDIKDFMDRLKTARDPGEVLSDLFDSSSEGTYMKTERNEKGTHVAYELKFIPGHKGKPAHAVETSYDDSGESHTTHIAFTEGERRAKKNL